jgi:hypothetical protein
MVVLRILDMDLEDLKERLQLVKIMDLVLAEEVILVV